MNESSESTPDQQSDQQQQQQQSSSSDMNSGDDTVIMSHNNNNNNCDNDDNDDDDDENIVDNLDDAATSTTSTTTTTDHDDEQKFLMEQPNQQSLICDSSNITTTTAEITTTTTTTTSTTKTSTTTTTTTELINSSTQQQRQPTTTRWLQKQRSCVMSTSTTNYDSSSTTIIQRLLDKIENLEYDLNRIKQERDLLYSENERLCFQLQMINEADKQRSNVVWKEQSLNHTINNDSNNRSIDQCQCIDSYKHTAYNRMPVMQCNDQCNLKHELMTINQSDNSTHCPSSSSLYEMHNNNDNSCQLNNDNINKDIIIITQQNRMDSIDNKSNLVRTTRITGGSQTSLSSNSIMSVNTNTNNNCNNNNDNDNNNNDKMSSSSSSTYEISQQLLEKKVSALERKYGGLCAREAAIKIQRSYRSYRLQKRFALLAIQAINLQQKHLQQQQQQIHSDNGNNDTTTAATDTIITNYKHDNKQQQQRPPPSIIYSPSSIDQNNGIIILDNNNVNNNNNNNNKSMMMMMNKQSSSSSVKMNQQQQLLQRQIKKKQSSFSSISSNGSIISTVSSSSSSSISSAASAASSSLSLQAISSLATTTTTNSMKIQSQSESRSISLSHHHQSKIMPMLHQQQHHIQHLQQQQQQQQYPHSVVHQQQQQFIQSKNHHLDSSSNQLQNEHYVMGNKMRNNSSSSSNVIAIQSFDANHHHQHYHHHNAAQSSSIISGEINPQSQSQSINFNNQHNIINNSSISSTESLLNAGHHHHHHQQHHFNNKTFVKTTKNIKTDANTDIYRKRLYRVGLNLFNKTPSERGIRFLIQHNFIEQFATIDKQAKMVAIFLLTRKGVSKQMIGEYLSDNNDFNRNVLKAFVSEINLAGLIVDEALRSFQMNFRFPGEAQKIERLVESFADRYKECNPNDVLSRDSIFILAFAIIMLNTDLHKPTNFKHRMTQEQWLNNLKGVFSEGDLSSTFLLGIYKRIKKQELQTGPDHVTQVLKVQSTIIGKDVPNLCLPHRRLVCYCRLYEIRDVNRKEKIGQHQRDVFLFNDLLLITKTTNRSRNNQMAEYQYRTHISLDGLQVTIFAKGFYAYGIRICRRVDQKCFALFNARNELDQKRFVEDLRESIAEMDEMEQIRITKSGSLVQLNDFMLTTTTTTSTSSTTTITSQ